jgi:putative acetyltransferase
MSPLYLRRERPDDVAAVDAVHRAAFPGDDEARLVAALRDNGHASPSLVAELDGQIVGHIVFSPVTLDPPAPLVGLGLAPVAVLPAHQRQGIGSRLIKEGIAECREMGVDYVVVLGHPAYYPRFGFRRGDEYGLGNEYGAGEAFMVIELRPGCLAGVRAVVHYGPEFGMFAHEPTE